MSDLSTYSQWDDKKVLLGFIGVSIITYNAVIQAWNYFTSVSTDFIPIGTIKELYIYPVKSCKGKSVFSYYCSPRGAIYREIRDRHFQTIDGEDGKVFTARIKPQLELVDVNVEDGCLLVKFPTGKEVAVRLDDVRRKRDVRKTTLFGEFASDGLDCGPEIATLLSDFLEEKDARMVMYDDSMEIKRQSITKDIWWNNPVPKRKDDIAFPNAAPFMIQTQASLDDLNSRLEQKIKQIQFRPVIVVDHCPAWDEDKWSDLRIGDVKMQCFKPCQRCILTTVNPETGTKNAEMQPLRELRKFRLAPEGKMRKEFKDSPIFGVNAAVDKCGYIHVGQVVYARYKKSAF